MFNIINLRCASSGFWILIVLLIFSFGCGGVVKEKDDDQERDTIKIPITPTNKLSPGKAQIEAYCLAIEKDDNYYKCIFKVEKVLGYGMSTKPIGKGSEIFLNLTQDEVDVINLLSEGAMEQKYVLTVEQEQLVDNQMKWRAVQVSEINHEK